MEIGENYVPWNLIQLSYMDLKFKTEKQYVHRCVFCELYEYCEVICTESKWRFFSA
jgi:hypothetical protein